MNGPKSPTLAVCQNWTCVSLNEMIIMNYPIPPLGVLHLPNIASKQDCHSFFQMQ